MKTLKPQVMKKTVVAYIRVSTDEQAEKGYSLLVQREKIEAYCKSRGWKILIIFQEDFSAWSNFERPEYSKLREYIKKSKEKVDYVLFTQWSRFSRNYSESVAELLRLKKIGIEANAIEQWVDHSVPESLYMLSIYLAGPQVENDRLSLRVKVALRKALQEGRWMGKAPYGYVNDKVAKIVLVEPKSASNVKFIFETFASGAFSIAEVQRQAQKRGVSIKKQQFINMLSNPFYVGKIFIKASDDEPDTFVKGIHDPIIDQETYDTVQFILSNKRKPYKGKTVGSELPLKGFLQCPDCGRLMTGSASTGNGGQYHYYHCQRKYGCSNSYPANVVNEAFIEYLKSFQVSDEVLSLYHEMLEDVFLTNDSQRKIQINNVKQEINRVQKSMESLDEKMTNGELPVERYNRLIDPLEQRKFELINQINTLNQSNNEFKEYIKFSISLLKDVQGYYTKASFLTKQKIIGSIFPENLVFDGKHYQTTRINEVFALICNTDKGLKKKQPSKITGLSTWAPKAGLEPATL